MNIITIHKPASAKDMQLWQATYSGNHASEIQELFGSDTIVTAYGTNTPAATVQAELQRLNPSVEIKIA